VLTFVRLFLSHGGWIFRRCGLYAAYIISIEVGEFFVAGVEHRCFFKVDLSYGLKLGNLV
jgi:hypothetical protein